MTMSATGSTSRFEDLGEQELKNIEQPVRVFNVGVGARLRPTATPAADVRR